MTETEQMDRLIRGLSHDMGAPLRAVVQFSELLDRRLSGALDEKSEYWLSLIRDNGKHSQMMLEALRVYQQLGRDDQKVEQIDLQALLSHTVDAKKQNYHSRSPQYPEPQIRFNTSLPSTEGRRKHWRLLFDAIVDNALRYQPLEDEAHVAVLEIEWQPHDDGRQIIFSDNGVGVDASQLADITRPFMRGQKDNDYSGIGMGLSYCDRIAYLNGGRLGFSPSPLGGLSVSYVYKS